MLTEKHHGYIDIIIILVQSCIFYVDNFMKSFIIVAGSLMQRLYSIYENLTDF